MIKDEEYINEIIENQSWKSYRALVERYQNRVFTLCYKIIKNREEAEELAQDIFVQGFSKLKDLKDKNKFPNWIMKIAYSRAIDSVRKKRILTTEISGVKEALLKTEETPIKKSIDSNRKEILKMAINRLEKVEAVVVTLYYIEDLPIKDIAEITGLSLSNIKVKLFRARASLKTIISDIVKTDLEDFIQE